MQNPQPGTSSEK